MCWHPAAAATVSAIGQVRRRTALAAGYVSSCLLHMTFLPLRQANRVGILALACAAGVVACAAVPPPPLWRSRAEGASPVTLTLTPNAIFVANGLPPLALAWWG